MSIDRNQRITSDYSDHKTRKSTEYINKVAKQFQPMVIKIARRMYKNLSPEKRKILDFEDLRGEGQVGLLQAINSFDPDKGANLKTHIYTRVQGAIKDCVRKLDHATRKDRNMLRKISEIDQVTKDESEVLAWCNENLKEKEEPISMKELQELRRIARLKLTSGNKLNNNPEDDGVMLFDMLTNKKANSPLDEAGQNERNQYLLSAIEQLEDKRKQVVISRCLKQRSIQKTADQLGLSPGRISFLYSDALKKLGEMISNFSGKN